MFCIVFFFLLFGDHRDRHVLTHSFPTRRSSDLLWAPALNDAGFAFAPDQLPVKPKLTDEPAATLACQPTFFAVTAAPDWVWSAFHACVICWPSVKEIGRAHV